VSSPPRSRRCGERRHARRRLNPRSASGAVIPTTLNASALRDVDGKVIARSASCVTCAELDKARAYRKPYKNAPDPGSSGPEGKTCRPRRRVAAVGFRQDELIEQSLSGSSASPETVSSPPRSRGGGARRHPQRPRLNPRSASGQVIPTALNARRGGEGDGKVIGAIGILRDMRELDKALPTRRADQERPTRFRLDLRARSCRPTTRCSRCSGSVPTSLIEQSAGRGSSARRRPGVTPRCARWWRRGSRATRG